MLTKTETEGCRKILDKLSYPDLFALVDTTTKKQIKVSRTSEAIKAILEYTPSALDLLKRKKVKREFLFTYLADEKVVVQPNIDKSGLIRTILKKWGIPLQDWEIVTDLEDDTSATQQVTQSQNQPEPPGNQPQPPGAQAQPPQNQSQPPQNQPQPGTSQGTYTGNQALGNNLHVGTLQTNGHGNQSLQTNNTATGVVSPDIQILGEKFAEWFYENLNTHSPSLQKTPGDFGPHHFWDDVYLVLNSCTPDPSTERLDGPVLVSQRFLAFVKDEHLLFNPNLTKEGIYVKSNPHGLVMILVCGTIHRNNECLGIFQQIFGLVKDPRYENNWKIKMTKLEVKASRTTAIPKLEGNLDRQIMAV